MSINISQFRVKLNINQVIALAFLTIILVGSFILMLPISTKTPGSCGFLTSLFTATSAVCVTGLSIVDVYSTFTSLGQFIILILMEIGGLGFMSIISILIHITRQKNSIQSLSLMSEALGSSSLLKDITRIQKRLLIGSGIIEILGAIALFFGFSSTLEFKTAIWFGIFHSVSAFCNAGFDLMGIFQKGAGLVIFQNNSLVLITISILITIGGIGFTVWDDIVSSKRIRDWSVYTKLVLGTSTALIIIGAVLFMLFESSNVNTLAHMDLDSQIINSLFQSVTTRTAGFAAVNQASLTDISKALTCILMTIGGSTGSTAGGIKTVTLIIILKSVISSACGRKNITLYKRSISQDQVNSSHTILSCFMLLSIAGSFIIVLNSHVTFIQSLFESISALATVGLSLGVTSDLSVLSHIILIIFMYIGRVGLLTLTMGFLKVKETGAIKYPSVNLLIG